MAGEKKPKLQMTKVKHRKGLWSPDEDERLRNYILQHGHGCSWSSVPINAGLERNGKSCRLRWINYLRPGLKRGVFTLQEEETILTLHRALGNKWSQIALELPGRTDNEIKNHWHSYLKKRYQADPQQKLDGAQLTKSTPEDKKHIIDSDYRSISPTKSTAIWSSELLQNAQGSSTSAGRQTHDQYSPSQLYQCCCSSSLPKLLFAEWLTVDADTCITNSDSLHGQSNFLVEEAEKGLINGNENITFDYFNDSQFELVDFMQDLAAAYNEEWIFQLTHHQY
ncbi:hypothetical protein Dimus_028257 [Dionaea muscipula]